MLNDPRHSPVQRRRRRGAIAVEYLFAAPIFFALIFGIIELGRVVMIHQMMTNAAREGARYAIVPGRTEDQVNTKIEGYLQTVFPEKTATEIDSDFDWGISPDPASVPSGTELTVHTEVSFADVAWGVHLIMSSDAVVRTEVKMRKE